MIQNKISNLKLFALFSVVNLRYYWWFYLFVSIGIVFSLSVVSYFQILGQPGEVYNMVKSTYWFFLNVGVINIAGSGLGIYCKKTNRIHLLTLPVSLKTRVFSLVFYSIFLPWLIFTVIFTLTANALSAIYSFMDFIDPFSFSIFQMDNFALNSLIFLVIQSLFLMFGSYFTRAGLIKTILSVAGVILVILLIDSITASNAVDKSIFWNLFILFNSESNVSKALVSEMSFLIFALRYFFAFTIPVAIYIVYLRIKELEV